MSDGHEPEGSQPHVREDPITLSEVASIAKTRIRKEVWDYYECGADTQTALHENEAAFKALKILPRVMRDVSNVNTSTSFFGRKCAVPFGLAPSAMQKLAGGDGEMDVARAAAKLGVNLTLSSQSTTSLEDVISCKKDSSSSLDPAFWMQLYLTKDPEKSIPLIKRAEASGYEALVLTVDTPVLGNRLNERKTPLVLPAGLHLANIELATRSPQTERKPTFNRRLMDARTLHDAEAILSAAGGSTHSNSLTWTTTIPFLKKAAPGMKIILKGIMTPEDAVLAVKHGVDAIVVSNHGGRQLDETCATIEALPGIHAVLATGSSEPGRKNRIPVIFDGGVRTGADVFKALALGADFVLVGRPVLWGLGYKGEEGVEVVINILERELSRTMALAGVARIEEIGKEYIGVKNAGGFGISKL
ncbi:S-2-hydroxy-acid oxidase [Hyaloscypha variabilis F]|uniref:S-2-hydroxy-acid oxidase n=1 Tax=Hyaloscypha variabilis (strain UAMH 11265 / GT02V1 / F) TaxID=1149755 RepID=A0A2J6RXC4_HYAVF|nr:S-2-hydroxy-acid oxidase [Hyaloscypha variabilis F]